ncbi:MAG TPA: DUF3014 domain-containing protein [Candidatus Binatia bacterium]|nr:DUF3014 domain-containing protein [Candidatus Binatia bacterium]
MKRIILWLTPVVVLAAFAALYFRPDTEEREPATVTAPTPAAPPAIRYPLEPTPEPLPLLAESDSNISDALIALFGKRLYNLINLQNIVQRIVATVDNLPRDHVSMRLMPVKPLKGLPLTTNMEGSVAFSPSNASRYEPYVRLAEAVPSDALVAVYLRFYPLFQQQYENLGYPGMYFNDRVVEVIDHLLATPEVQEPLRLVQPGILYEFEDQYLESLSAGQKLMLRMGQANRLKLTSKLREIRGALTSAMPQ